MVEENIVFPLKPWQKACLNAVLVAGITSASTASSMLATGDIANPHLFHSILLSMVLSGGITFFVTLNTWLKKDLDNDDNGTSFTPLMLIGGK